MNLSVCFVLNELYKSAENAQLFCAVTAKRFTQADLQMFKRLKAITLVSLKKFLYRTVWVFLITLHKCFISNKQKRK